MPGVSDDARVSTGPHALNRGLFELLEAHKYEQAAVNLHQYLLDSEQGLLAAFRSR
jgi:hypothetical protein